MRRRCSAGIPASASITLPRLSASTTMASGFRMSVADVAESAMVSSRASPPAASRIFRALRRSIAQLRATRTSHDVGPTEPRVVRLRTRPYPDEHFLKDLLGLGPIPHDSQDEAEQEPAVTVVEVRQRSGVAADNALQETDVSRVVEMHCAGSEPTRRRQLWRDRRIRRKAVPLPSFEKPSLADCRGADTACCTRPWSKKSPDPAHDERQ